MPVYDPYLYHGVVDQVPLRDGSTSEGSFPGDMLGVGTRRTVSLFWRTRSIHAIALIEVNQCPLFFLPVPLIAGAVLLGLVSQIQI